MSPARAEPAANRHAARVRAAARSGVRFMPFLRFIRGWAASVPFVPPVRRFAAVATGSEPYTTRRRAKSRASRQAPRRRRKPGKAGGRRRPGGLHCPLRRQQALNFLPEPHGQGSLRPTLFCSRRDGIEGGGGPGSRSGGRGGRTGGGGSGAAFSAARKARVRHFVSAWRLRISRSQESSSAKRTPSTLHTATRS